MSLLVMPGRRAGTRLLAGGGAIATGPHPLEAKLFVGKTGTIVGFWKGNVGTLTPNHAWGAEVDFFAVDDASDHMLLGFVGGVQPAAAPTLAGFWDVQVRVHPSGSYPLKWSAGNARYEYNIPGAGAYFNTLIDTAVIVGFIPDTPE